MHARALLVPLSVALVACLDPSSTSDPLPDPAPAGERAPAAWPIVPGYDADADVRLREALAGSHFASGMEVVVEDGVFVLAARSAYLLDDSVQRTHDALAALLNGRFSRLPSRAVTVYVLDDRASFAELCADRLGKACSPTWLGVWIKETREILVDQSLGRTTLVHELVHPLLENEAPALPRWIREGISALFEHPEVHGLEIHGTTNWRLDDLRRALASRTERELVHLDTLFRMPDDLFDGDHALAAYSVARFACQWWDSPGQDRLWRLYQAWRDHADVDPTGEKAFAGVFGQSPREADAAWQKWVRSL